MPFERYLRDDHVVNNNLNYFYQDIRDPYYDADCHRPHGQNSCLPDATYHNHHHPHGVHFQIPQYVLDGPPILAPGGGAEVLPAGLLDNAPDSFASSWFANNGFTPFHSSLISRQGISDATCSDDASARSSHTLYPNTFPPRITTSVAPRQQPSPSIEATANYVPDPTSPPSTGSFNPTLYPPSNLSVPDPAPPLSVTTPSTFGLPVYSTSGFDVLSILSRVVNRPNPTIQLGPVDLSCSFVIVDVRRHDSPIVYASPTFCHLTGYREQEILGRNCRFLQSPVGHVAKGEPRRFASPEAVSHMGKSLSSHKECQTTLINYRKGGKAFINLVSIIPLRGGVYNTPEEADEVVYHIGFQVDLTEQPTRILDKLRDGSCYSVENSSWGAECVSRNGWHPALSHGLGPLVRAQNMSNIGLKGGKHGQMMSIAMSKELRNLFADTTFTDSVAISTGTNTPGPTGVSNGSAGQGNTATMPLTTFVTPPSSVNRTSSSGNTMAGSIPVSLSPSLSLLLLEFLPDFLLVLSLKGALLYVAPSVRLVLGYEPQDLVGRGISDFCHPADLVPLMRELKEGSVSGLNIPGTGDVVPPLGATSNFNPKSVDLLFRALPKSSASFSCGETQPISRSSQLPSPTSPSQSPSSLGTLGSNDSSSGGAPPYIWLECRGRLHVEPGKGRKAIILSGRARWMPIVRWGSIDKAGGVGGTRCQGDSVHGASQMTAGSWPSSGVPGASVDRLEFWALLSSQGTFLVASASVRDVLGWGTSEVIGRSICAMVRDSEGGMREHVEAELAKLDTPEVGNAVDPPPSVVTTSLVHRELHTVPMRLAFYRTPRSDPSSRPLIGAPSTSLVHPLNNPLCPIVVQATVLSDPDSGHGPRAGDAPSRVQIRIDTDDDTEAESPSMHSLGASLFGELQTVEGSSWQYELQQLKFANQRLHEELNALEGAYTKSGTGTTSSVASRMAASLGQPSSSSVSNVATSVPPQVPPTQVRYTPLMHSSLSTTLSLLRPSIGLHEQDPPSSDWSSLAGANDQGPTPLKRSWRSENGPTT